MTRKGSCVPRRSVQPNRRAGAGLMEVIICTALVAVMVIPLAGVIRASGQSISRADGSPTTEADLRRGLRWLGDTIRTSQVLVVRPRRLQLQLSTGDVAVVRVRRGTLTLTTGSTVTTLAENVREIRFTDLIQTSAPGQRIGVMMELRARDPATRAFVTVDSTIAIPPQA